jgi:hypothetical protein
MSDSEKPSIWIILISVAISLVILGNGVYVLIKKETIIAGKYTGHHYYLGDNESIVTAISLFLISACVILNLFQRKIYKQIAAWLLGIGLALYFTSTFI